MLVHRSGCGRPEHQKPQGVLVILSQDNYDVLRRTQNAETRGKDSFRGDLLRQTSRCWERGGQADGMEWYVGNEEGVQADGGSCKLRWEPLTSSRGEKKKEKTMEHKNSGKNITR